MTCQRKALCEPALQVATDSRPLGRQPLRERLQNAVRHEFAELLGRSIVYLGAILGLMLLARHMAV